MDWVWNWNWNMRAQVQRNSFHFVALSMVAETEDKTNMRTSSHLSMHKFYEHKMNAGPRKKLTHTHKCRSQYVCELIEYWGFLQNFAHRVVVALPSLSIRLNAKHTKENRMEFVTHAFFSIAFCFLPCLVIHCSVCVFISLLSARVCSRIFIAFQTYFYWKRAANKTFFPSFSHYLRPRILLYFFSQFTSPLTFNISTILNVKWN